ncbi:MAG TPA: bifunctional folylpolyglutamate synthase/dihydrofolate synthase [Candidatus Scatomorpha intestinavium]|uniref:tetrahydrofolate synthase n=1 Tax=Candidatus Scatomorpha intestinavium TaxID=2840922 RepID=A0A9D0ZF05_9FIRM|nr:bifunctional folylpolyglutamate synthase/dihydrofolate synthase [Candidatus Scatomorpha intestinavium]
MDYDQALKYIEGVSYLGVKPGLERVSALLGRLGHPERKTRFVHVAGTNGKGSTSVMTASALSACGYKTGLYTSPHLARVNERMRLDGAEIPDGEFARVVSALASAAEGLAEPCTEFELLTAAALLWFAEAGADIAVLEVGMGGRFDATNVIPRSECAVITNIGLDHTAVLGDTVEAIAAEKAGIFKGGRAVSYEQPESVAAVLRSAAAKTGTELTFADFSKIEPLSDSVEGQRFRFEGEEYSIRLLGAHQLKNAAVALTALDTLRRSGWDLPAEGVRKGLAAAVWPARFELVERAPLFVVDGGHNPQCVAATAEAIRRYMPGGHCVILMGVLADKNWSAMIDILADVAEGFVCAAPDSPRALPAADLGAELLRRGLHAEVCSSVPEAVEAAKALAGPDGAVCSVGSLYMSGAVRACFGLR